MPSSVTTLPAWNTLAELALSEKNTSILALFEQDPQRAKKYSATLDGVYIDYSKNRVSDKVLKTLFELAEQANLSAKTQALFNGEKINTSEERAVLHTTLREPKPRNSDITTQKHKLKTMSDSIRNGLWLGSTGKAISDVINIGIGGSDLGPKMVCTALKEFSNDKINVHFISNVDGAEILSLLKTLRAETTLIIVASKTFTTQETMLNANTALDWFAKAGIANAQSSPHCIGITATPSNALAFGVPTEQIIEFWDWVGGRYSLWSSIGLAIAIDVGYDNFEQLLAGAHRVDQHFLNTPAQQNIPVIMALLGIWYSNFLGAQSTAVLPYCERLGFFPSYLQQLDMESNGKRVSADGETLDYSTGSIVWGQTGTNGQHAFFQLLHQGSHLVPVDFIATVTDRLSKPQHHSVLLGNMLAQAAALMAGQQSDNTPAHKIYPGNKPSTVILLEQLNPKTLGMLIALYEHKVFVQGAIWNINSFDQWGVELGKSMAKALLSDEKTNFDASTQQLFKYISR